MKSGSLLLSNAKPVQEAPPLRDTPQIERELNILAEVIGSVEGISGRLSDRLERILAPAIPTPCDPTLKDVERMAPLAETIKDLRIRLAAARDLLVSTDERIEI